MDLFQLFISVIQIIPKCEMASNDFFYSPFCSWAEFFRDDPCPFLGVSVGSLMGCDQPGA